MSSQSKQLVKITMALPLHNRSPMQPNSMLRDLAVLILTTGTLACTTAADRPSDWQPLSLTGVGDTFGTPRDGSAQGASRWSSAPSPRPPDSTPDQISHYKS